MIGYAKVPVEKVLYAISVWDSIKNLVEYPLEYPTVFEELEMLCSMARWEDDLYLGPQACHQMYWVTEHAFLAKQEMYSEQ